jgi:anti-anti-sigma regulatory factor
MGRGENELLRITEIFDDGDEVVMKLEGKVVGVWVPDLESICLFHRDEMNKVVVLDFSGVTFIEEKGLRMLQDLKNERVRIVNCSPFIYSLLNKLISRDSGNRNEH